MKVRLDEPAEKKQEPAHQMMDWTSRLYRSFESYVKLNDDDPIWMMACKLGFRFAGILFMLLLSPFILVGFGIAIAAVL